MQTIKSQRISAIDIIRGVLVVCMILYHAVYCLAAFSVIRLELYTGFWWWFPRCIAAGFLVLSGWSLASSRARGQTFRKAIRRILKLTGLAIGVSVVTYITFGLQYFVFFGILHAIALFSLIAWPIAAPSQPVSGRHTAVLVIIGRMLLGLIILTAGLWLGTMRFAFPWLAWLGFRPANLYPVDYEPLLPWLAWFLFGIALYEPSLTILTGFNASTAQEHGTEHERRNEKYSKNLAHRNEDYHAQKTQQVHHAQHTTLHHLSRVLSFLGRHSLIIYLVHLPVLYSLSWCLARGLSLIGR